MTILNYYCTPERAVIAVDTIAQPLNGLPPREASKVMVLPAAGVALASRGPTDLLALVVQAAQALMLGFDELAELLPQFIPEKLGEMRAHYAAAGVDMSAHASVEVALIGWSSARGRIEARFLRADEQACEISEADQIVAPGEFDHSRLVREGYSKQAMLEAMRTQYAMVKARGDAVGFGGRMLYVELTRNGISIDSTARL